MNPSSIKDNDRFSLDRENLQEYTSSDYSLEQDSSGRVNPLGHTANSSNTLRGAEKTSPLSSNSPVSSPRAMDRYSNFDASSAYALQVALKSMKERYQKLQVKMGLLEDENQRLINGKSELFGEIGKMQESSIKLREKNLQLNHEVHSQHQECCSLKKKYVTLSQEKITLTHKLAKSNQDNRKLSKHVNQLEDENEQLKEKIHQITIQVKQLPSIPASTINNLVSSWSRPLTSTTAKTKIVPISDDLESFDSPPSRFQTSARDLDEFEQISDSEAMDVISLPDFGEDNESSEEYMMASLVSVSRRMKCLLSQVQDQQRTIATLGPKINTCMPGDNRTLGQRDRDMTTMTVNSRDDQVAKNMTNSLTEDEEKYLSRLATCGSVMNPNNISSGNVITLSPLTSESGGDNNLMIDKQASGGRPQSPFDWRKMQVSDEEYENPDNRPEMRNVSTSPDPALSSSDSGPMDKTCPMCNAVFPPIVPFESFESHVVSHFEVENGFEVVA